MTKRRGTIELAVDADPAKTVTLDALLKPLPRNYRLMKARLEALGEAKVDGDKVVFTVASIPFDVKGDAFLKAVRDGGTKFRVRGAVEGGALTVEAFGPP